MVPEREKMHQFAYPNSSRQQPFHHGGKHVELFVGLVSVSDLQGD
jgi:hypothetical protein